jgi:hypothetical protein
MSRSVCNGRPAGTPSTTVIRPRPCDSPAVRKLKCISSRAKRRARCSAGLRMTMMYIGSQASRVKLLPLPRLQRGLSTRTVSDSEALIRPEMSRAKAVTTSSESWRWNTSTKVLMTTESVPSSYPNFWSVSNAPRYWTSTSARPRRATASTRTGIASPSNACSGTSRLLITGGPSATGGLFLNRLSPSQAPSPMTARSRVPAARTRRCAPLRVPGINPSRCAALP